MSTSKIIQILRSKYKNCMDILCSFNFIYLYFYIGVQSDVYLLGPILIKEDLL